MNENIKSSLANKLLILCGAIGPIFLIFSYIIQERLREGYNPIMVTISALAIGPEGWVQTLTFLIAGALIIFFGYGLFKLRKTEKFSKLTPFFIIICGIGLIGAGIFVTDPINGFPPELYVSGEGSSFYGIIHKIFAGFLFVGLPLACFAMDKYFKFKEDLKWRIYTLFTGISSLIVFLLTTLAILHYGGLQYYAGLLERITIIIGFLWMILLSWYFLKG